MPGDFSDDGQPVHMRGLKAIMDRYTDEHGGSGQIFNTLNKLGCCCIGI